MNNIENYDKIIKSLTYASDVHKKVRQYLFQHIKPNIKLLDIVNIIENKTIELSKYYNTINKGIGFPASLSLNECVAHYHPKK
jgi:methionyl aminopeptidase